MSVGVGPFRFYSQGRRRPTAAQRRARQESWDRRRLAIAQRRAGVAVTSNGPTAYGRQKTVALRICCVLGWAWVAFFVMGLIGSIAHGDLAGVLLSALLSGVPALLLLRKAASAQQDTTV